MRVPKKYDKKFEERNIGLRNKNEKRIRLI